MKTAALIMAILLICGCAVGQPAESSEMAKAESSEIETIPVIEPSVEITQPPCLVCEDTEINPSTNDISKPSEAEKLEMLYTSNAPAKQSWLLAYKSFYDILIDSPKNYIDDISLSFSHERARNNLELRSDMGIDFIYPIHETLFVHVDTIASNGSAVEVMVKCLSNGGVGMLVNYKDDDNFAGEIVFGKDDIFANEIIYNSDSPPEFIPFEQGNYINRTSLTVTEGIEAQLLDFGFEPETTMALALRLSDDEYGICFYDEEKAAYYNNVTKHGKSLEQKLYSFEELRDALCEVYDVCSVDEIDALYAEPETDGINIGKIVSNPVTAKPVIYLYPESETEVSVKLGYPAEHFTYTYPAYNGGWNVTAYPYGRLVNSDGTEHFYLFWEGDMPVAWDFSEGFVVKGGDVEAFLKEKLEYMGLIPREYNDFITYWAPEMSKNAYNIITFSTEQYENIAPLEITPEPDSVLRVHMVYKPIDVPVEIKPQQLEKFERIGFTVVEWGGSRA